MRLITPETHQDGDFRGKVLRILLGPIALALLPFIGGCVCDPPVERLAVKTRPHAKRVALAVPTKPLPTRDAASPSATAVVKPIRIKRCDCPQEFDPHICGNRSAYTWSTDCGEKSSGVLQPTAPVSLPPPASVAKPDKATPASLKGPVQP